MYHHHCVFNKNRHKINYFVMHLTQKPFKLQGLKFYMRITITIREPLKKTADWYLLWEQSYDDFKKSTFWRRHSNLFAPTVARVGGRKVAYFPVSTSQDLQPPIRMENLESHITYGSHVPRSWPGIQLKMFLVFLKTTLNQWKLYQLPNKEYSIFSVCFSQLNLAWPNSDLKKYM